MNIRRIHLQNFRLHADTEVVVPESGVTAIVGGNETGKSTILEGVVWAFFGGDHTRGKVAGLRWFGAPPRSGAKVVVDFASGGQEYRVERLESTARLFAMPSEKVIAQGTSPVSEAIPGIIGMGHKEFSSTALCGQKDVEALARMGPTDRVAFIRQVLQMEKIDEALKSLRKRKNEMASYIEGLDASIEDTERLESEVNVLTDQVEHSQASRDAAVRRVAKVKEELSEVESNLREERQRKEKVDELVRLREESKREVARLRERQEEESLRITTARDASAELEGLPVEDELRSRLSHLAEQKELWADLRYHEKTLEEAATKVKSKRNLLDVLFATKARLESESEEIGYDPEALGRISEKIRATRESYADKYRAHRASATTYRTEEEKALKRVRAITEAGEGACCPTCMRGMEGDVYTTVMQALSDHLASVRSMAKKADADAEQAQADAKAEIEPLREAERREIAKKDGHEEAQRDLNRLATKIEATSTAVDEALAQEKAASDAVERTTAQIGMDMSTVEREERRTRETLNLRSRLEERASGLAKAKATLSSLQEREGLEVARQFVLAEEIEHIPYSESNLKTLESSVARVREAATKVEATAAACRATLAAQRDELTRAENRLGSLRRKAEEVEAQKAEYRVVSQATEMMEGFRVAVTSTIRPEMEELMSGFYAALTDGRHEAVELNEDFSVQVYESGNAPDTLSGGATDQLALAQRLALSLMMAQRSGNPINLLFLDEPFGSLEESRRHNVLNLIRELSSVFTQVLVISHVAETKDAADHVVELVHDSATGSSRVAA